MPKLRTIIHSSCLKPAQLDFLRKTGSLEARPGHYLLLHDHPVDTESLRRQLHCDVNTLPENFDPTRVKLLITDLDSTLIGIETIDEIADELGLKQQVARITERAMEGELDFAAALKERVALLEGLPANRLERVFEDKMKPAIQPGALATLAWLKRRGIVTAVVSGGFTFFTDRLRKILPIDYARACVLKIDSGVLTGQLEEPIIDQQAKVDFLMELARQLKIEHSQIVVMGDGANDVPMLQLAGLGVAYHGHTVARRHADARIDHGDWSALCHLISGS